MLKAASRKIVGQFPIQGYRRVMPELQRYSRQTHRKHVVRLIGELYLHTRINRFPCHANFVQELLIPCPNQIWLADIIYSRLEVGPRFRVDPNRLEKNLV